VREVLEKRLLLVAGKGGVGRSTVTAAIALAAARDGKRVLIVEFEEPTPQTRSPLAELFGRSRFSPHPQRLSDGVYGVTAKPERGTELFLGAVFKTPRLVGLAMRSKALLRFFHATPSLHEMGLFYHVQTLEKMRNPDGSMRFDLLVIDMPATGHALALAGLPAVLLRLIPRGPVADAVTDGQKLLHDPQRTSTLVVTLPETLPVSESLELIEGLSESEVSVGGVLVNRVPGLPFSADEMKALEELKAGRKLLGLRTLERLSRAESSIDRLQRAITLPVFRLPECPETGQELADAVSIAISNLVSHPPQSKVTDDRRPTEPDLVLFREDR